MEIIHLSQQKLRIVPKFPYMVVTIWEKIGMWVEGKDKKQKPKNQVLASIYTLKALMRESVCVQNEKKSNLIHSRI